MRSDSLVLTTLFVLVGVIASGVKTADTHRLPQSVKPHHYDLEVITHLHDANNFKFDGIVKIDLTALESVDKIILHSKDLKIDERMITIKAIDGQNQAVSIIGVGYDKEFDFLTLSLGGQLSKDAKYTLTIPFEGALQPGLVGYYRSSYKNGKNEDEWLAVTQFEANYARRAFPCFDEPSMKATYSISLGRIKEYTSISNMPLAKTKEIAGMPGWEMDTFEKSVPMSTYLVAYMVSKFKYLESPKTKANETTFRVWAREQAIDQTQYATMIGPKILSHYEDYFGVKYPLPKQDMVAVPDFHAGAMENWGLITYRETALLYKDHVSSVTNMYRVCSVVAHELAHQWFGNLVTMKWWTDLWLNEGFATYVSTLGVNHIHPEWNIIKDESADNYVDVFRLDALNNSHPVSVPIGHPREIDQIFDAISYKKGSALIRMMNEFLTEDVFREGVNKYLNEYQYNNAEQDDLWRKLTEAAHKSNSLPKDLNVKTIMDSWTTQTGYPIVTINRDYNAHKAHVTQQRYLGIAVPSETAAKQTWWVPLTYMKKGDNATIESAKIHWIPKTQRSEIEDAPMPNTWLLGNVDMSGLYRVNYDNKNWQLLIKAMEMQGHDGIPELNRFQLLLDSMDFAWTGQLEYDIALRMMQYLKNENDYIPWKGAMIGLGRLNGIMRRSPDYAVFKKYMRSLLNSMYSRVGAFQDYTDKNAFKLDTIEHDVMITRWACSMDVAGCKQKALEHFYQWMAGNHSRNTIPLNYRSTTYCIAIKKGGEAEWDFLWRQYLKSNVASEQVLILRNLGCSTDVWIHIRYLEWMISEKTGLRKQDAISVFNAVGSSDVGYYVAKKFLFERVADLRHFERATPQNMGKYAAIIAAQISSEFEYKEFNNWVNENQEHLKNGKIAIDQAMESARIRLEWIKKNQKHVVDILREITKS